MQRLLEPEEMDDPSLGPQEHSQALAGLARINFWSGSAGSVWSAIRDLAPKDAARPLRVLDIATGGGDIPIALWKKARREGLRLEISGCDKSSQALDFAKKRAEQNAAPIHFFALDIFSDTIPSGYDVLVSSLFFHHLEAGRAADLLGRMARAAGKRVVVNDLARGRRGLFLATVAPFFLSASPIVHADARRSARASFTLEEMRRMALEQGLSKVRVRPRWPRRFLLTWEKSACP